MARLAAVGARVRRLTLDALDHSEVILVPTTPVTVHCTSQLMNRPDWVLGLMNFVFLQIDCVQLLSGVDF